MVCNKILDFGLQFIVLAAFVAVAKAGFIGAPAQVSYAAAPAAVQYAAPAYAHAPAAYAHPAPVAYAQPAQVAYAQPAQVAYAQPIAKAVVAKTIDADYDPNPQYSYAYDVQDGLTGDSKSQQESRNGDVVQGSYSLVEADGTRRIVEYTADPENGFNAVVHKEPAQVAVKTVAAAPVVKAVHAAPAVYSAPAHYKVAAPLGYAAAPAAYATQGYHL